MRYKPFGSFVLGLSLAVGLLACAREAAEEATTQEAATATVESVDVLAEVRSSYEEHYSSGNAPALADLYTEDAVNMPSSGSYAVGRPAISGGMEGTLAASPTLRVKALETKVHGDVAFERGSYSVEMTPEGAEPMGFSGHYVTFSKKQADGSWKLQWLLSNYDADPPAEVAASMTQGLATVEAGGDATLDGFRDAWQSAYNQADGAGTAAMHTEDGATMFASQPALEGRAAFAAFLEEAFMASPQTEITQVDTEIIGDWAVARGTYAQQLTPPEGEPTSQSGYWMYVGKKGEDGAWKIHWLITNAVAPTM